MQIKALPHSFEDICWCLHPGTVVVTKGFFCVFLLPKKIEFEPFLKKNEICWPNTGIFEIVKIEW